MAALIARRLALIPFQAFGVVTVVFILVHLIPGNPAYTIAGPQATPRQIELIEQDLGLDQPLFTQYIKYIGNVVQGDLGTAWHTGNAVLTDLAQKAPATLSLIALSMVGAIILGLFLAGVIAANVSGIGGAFVRVYGFVAGALPDFWVGLALIYLLWFQLGVGSPPTGQFSTQYLIPIVTGVGPIDALIAGNTAAFWNSLQHLILPVLTLVIAYSGFVVRATSSAAQNSLSSDFIEFADGWGIKPWRRVYYALRDVIPVFILTIGATVAFLLGGAVIIETIFSWGGLGQYAVEAIRLGDYAAIQGFVLLAGVFTVVVYAAVDVLQMIFDPRVGR